MRFFYELCKTSRYFVSKWKFYYPSLKPSFFILVRFIAGLHNVEKIRIHSHLRNNCLKSFLSVYIMKKVISRNFWQKIEWKIPSFPHWSTTFENDRQTHYLEFGQIKPKFRFYWTSFFKKIPLLLKLQKCIF